LVAAEDLAAPRNRQIDGIGREQISDQHRAAFGGLMDHRRKSAVVGIVQLGRERFATTEDDGQQVVKLVPERSRERADFVLQGPVPFRHAPPRPTGKPNENRCFSKYIAKLTRESFRWKYASRASRRRGPDRSRPIRRAASNIRVAAPAGREGT